MATLPDTNEGHIDVLDVFLESVTDLTDPWFVRQVLANGISSIVELFPDGSTDAVVDGPERDALKAVLLTLRFFTQSGTECSSIGNIATIIAEPDFGVRPELITEYSNTQAELNAYLDSPPAMVLPAQMDAATKRKIYDTILYGRFAHANPTKRKLALQWEGDSLAALIETEFLTIVMDFINRADLLAQTVRKIRDEHAC